MHNLGSGALSPVSIQTRSLALRALRKRKPQETQAIALASSQSWLPLFRPSIPIGWRLRLLRETQSLAFLRFSFTQRTQRKRLRLNGNRALDVDFLRFQETAMTPRQWCIP